MASTITNENTKEKKTHVYVVALYCNVKSVRQMLNDDDDVPPHNLTNQLTQPSNRGKANQSIQFIYQMYKKHKN